MSDLLSIPEGAGRVFVIYNTSYTVTPAYAATLVLVFSLGWIALIALVYYYLISGAFSSKGYSSGSSHSHYNAQKRGTNFAKIALHELYKVHSKTRHEEV